MRKLAVAAVALWLLSRTETQSTKKSQLDLPVFRPQELKPTLFQPETDPSIRRMIEANQERATAQIADAMRARRTAREGGINFLNRLQFGGTRKVVDGKEQVKIAPASLRPPEFAALYYLATLQSLLVSQKVWDAPGFQLAFKAYMDTMKNCAKPSWETLAGNLLTLGMWLGALSSLLGVVLGVIGLNPVLIMSSSSALLGSAAKIGIDLYQASTVAEAQEKMRGSQEALQDIFKELGPPPMSLVHALDAHGVFLEETAKANNGDCKGALQWWSRDVGYYQILFRLLHLSSELDNRGWPLSAMMANMAVTKDDKVKAVPLYTRFYQYQVIRSSDNSTILYRNYERVMFWGGQQGSTTLQADFWQNGAMLLLWFDLRRFSVTAGLDGVYRKLQARRKQQLQNSPKWFVYSPMTWKTDATAEENKTRFVFLDIRDGWRNKKVKLLFQPSNSQLNCYQTYPTFEVM